MKILTLIISIIIPFLAGAQTLQGQHEIIFSAGAISGRQVGDALSGEKGPMETMFTPSFFAGYRYYLLDKLALGFTIGTQIIWGRNSDDNSSSPYTYKLTNSTVAAEFTYVYRDFNKCQLYFLFGAGMSHFMERDVYLQSSAPILSSGNNFNFQYTPFGIRLGGGVAAFLEFGIGYKGLANLGISYKFSGKKLSQRQKEMANFSSKEIIVLPYDYPVDNNLKELGTVKTGNPKYSRSVDFYDQLDKLAYKVKRKQGNVFRLSQIKEKNQEDYYKISGKACYTAQFDSFKNKLQSEKNALFENNTCAYLTIYRPNYKQLLYSRKKIKLTFNDTTALELKKKSKMVIRITKEGRYKVALNNSDFASYVDVKFGNNYYIKAIVELPKGYGFWGHSVVSNVDNLKGELESSVITHVAKMEMAK